jgi:hypothetical protein
LAILIPAEYGFLLCGDKRDYASAITTGWPQMRDLCIKAEESLRSRTCQFEDVHYPEALTLIQRGKGLPGCENRLPAAKIAFFRLRNRLLVGKTVSPVEKDCTLTKLQ